MINYDIYQLKDDPSLLVLSWDVMISLCHAVMRLPG